MKKYRRKGKSKGKERWKKLAGRVYQSGKKSRSDVKALILPTLDLWLTR